jgi:arylsulfatase A-like enzyme
MSPKDKRAILADLNKKQWRKKMADNRRPNILLIMTDQQTATAMSCTGNEWLKTPAMDSLAASGTRFERSYVTQPLCLPCRSSFQTGRYPHEIGTISNGRDIKGDFPMLGKLMDDAGYECAYVGKWHVGTSFEAAGYKEADDPGHDDKKTDAVVSFLEREHSKPFFLTASYMNPHNVCQLARRQALPDGPIGDPPADSAELPPLPPNFEIPLNEPSAIRKVQRENTEFHYPTQDWDERDWREYLWGYYRLVEKVDAEIDRVLEVLRDRGLDKNTVVIFMSDHGEGVAMHRWNQKQILYDQSTRVPTIISSSGKTEPGVSNTLVSAILDIPVTILDFARADIPDSLPGLSLQSLVMDGVAELDREFVVSETMFAKGATNLGLTGRMVRTDRFKYCVYDLGEDREQLFNMDADPGETMNLVGDSEHGAELNRHRRMLTDWADQTQDRDFPHVPPSDG